MWRVVVVDGWFVVEGVLFILPPLAYGLSGGLAGDAVDEHGALHLHIQPLMADAGRKCGRKLMLCSLPLMLFGWCILGPAPFLKPIFDRCLSDLCGMLRVHSHLTRTLYQL